jgi:hypothetical protein
MSSVCRSSRVRTTVQYAAFVFVTCGCTCSSDGRVRHVCVCVCVSICLSIAPIHRSSPPIHAPGVFLMQYPSKRWPQ